MIKRVTSPIPQDEILSLNAGDSVYLSGPVYCMRDAAHKRFIGLLDCGLPLPFDILGQTVYYAGPCPARPGEIIGSCGPTTSSRMDVFTPRLLDMGLKAMIGKGGRGSDVIDSMIKNKAVYLAAPGGAGALIASLITDVKTVAFSDLGAEAVYLFTFKDFPLVCAIDACGNNLYESGRKLWAAK